MRLLILTLICATAINAEEVLNENVPPKPLVNEGKQSIQANPNVRAESVPDAGDKVSSPLSVENKRPLPIKYEESLEFLKSLKSSKGSPREARQIMHIKPDEVQPQVIDDSKPEERSLLLFTLSSLGLAKKTWLLLRLKKRFTFPFLLFKSAAGDDVDPDLIANSHNVIQLNTSQLKDLIEQQPIVDNLNPEAVINSEPENSKESFKKKKLALEKFRSGKLSGRKFHAHKLKFPSRFLHGEQ